MRDPLLWELNEHDLEASGAGELQGRQTVGISSDQNNTFYRPVGGIGGDVETDSHIHPLLLEPRLEVLIGQGAPNEGCFLRHEASELQGAEANGETRSGGESFEPFVGSVEIGRFARYRQFGTALIRSAIVVQDAEQDFIRHDTSVSNGLNVIRIVTITGLTGKNSKVATIDKNSCSQMKRPPTGNP